MEMSTLHTTHYTLHRAKRLLVLHTNVAKTVAIVALHKPFLRSISYGLYNYGAYYLLNYLLTELSPSEPLIVQPLKNFPAFHGTRKFNTVFTKALHWSLS
jgi:hypothetical protein